MFMLEENSIYFMNGQNAEKVAGPDSPDLCHLNKLIARDEPDYVVRTDENGKVLSIITKSKVRNLSYNELSSKGIERVKKFYGLS